MLKNISAEYQRRSDVLHLALQHMFLLNYAVTTDKIAVLPSHNLQQNDNLQRNEAFGSQI